MPTLTRLLVVLALIAAVVFGAMLALAYLVKPVTHEMTIEIPPAKIRQSVIEPQAAQTQPETGAETAEQGGN